MCTYITIQQYNMINMAILTGCISACILSLSINVISFFGSDKVMYHCKKIKLHYISSFLIVCSIIAVIFTYYEIFSVNTMENMPNKSEIHAMVGDCQNQAEYK